MEAYEYNLNYISIKNIYFKRLSILYLIFSFTLFMELHFNVEIPSILWLTIASINFISLYFSFKYTSVNLNLFFVNITKIISIFLIIFSSFNIAKSGELIVVKLNFLSNSDLEWKGNIVLTSIIISLMMNMMNLSWEKSNKKYRTFLIFTITIISVISFNLVAKFLSYRFVYLINICIFIRTFLKFKSFKIKQDRNLNISKIILILLILSDSLSFLFVNYSIFYDMAIIRFILINYFLTYSNIKLVQVDSNIHYRYLKKINKNLDTINKAIDERNKELEEAGKILVRQNYIYKRFLKIVKIPIAIVSSENNRILYINRKFLELCNKTQIRDVINKKLESFININEKIYTKGTERKEFFIASLENNKSTSILEVCFISSGNNKLIIINDITEKENIDRIKKELERKKIDEKMKSNFLSHISHDLKTPIGVIYSSVQLMDIYLKQNRREEMKKYNLSCKENCLYLTRLTNNLMDISRITEKSLKANLERDNIVYFIEDKINYLSEHARLKDVTIVFDTNKEEIFIEFDRNFTERIIFNLLSNALKYSNTKGEVLINIIDKDEVVDIEISDNGKGMSKEFVSRRAFNVYSMENDEEKSYQSNGIGLFVVYNLLRLQGAGISLQSELGKGSKFTLTYRKGIFDEQII